MDGLTLNGRLAIVTGGAGGIGAAICRDLAAIGASVVVADIDLEGAEQVAKGIEGAHALRVDLGDPSSIDAFVAAVARFGHPEVLVSNAGFDIVGPFVQSDPATWDRLLAINLRAPIQLTHALLPGMLERRFGRLVFVSSDAARVGSSGEAVYAAAKAGLLGFAKTIARETARFGVTSNAVCPGPTDTPLLKAVGEQSPRLVEALKRSIPIGRLGRPEDVSGLVAYLCSERAEYVTGQVLSVSGGLTMV
jgi:2-hydroxycyclohexanecarboxyl-CoA dehydrogenase